VKPGDCVLVLGVGFATVTQVLLTMAYVQLLDRDLAEAIGEVSPFPVKFDALIHLTLAPATPEGTTEALPSCGGRVAP